MHVKLARSAKRLQEWRESCQDNFVVSLCACVAVSERLSSASSGTIAALRRIRLPPRCCSGGAGGGSKSCSNITIIGGGLVGTNLVKRKVEKSCSGRSVKREFTSVTDIYGTPAASSTAVSASTSCLDSSTTTTASRKAAEIEKGDLHVDSRIEGTLIDSCKEKTSSQIRRESNRSSSSSSSSSSRNRTSNTTRRLGKRGTSAGFGWFVSDAGFGGTWRHRRNKVQLRVRKAATRSLDTLDALFQEGRTRFTASELLHSTAATQSLSSSSDFTGSASRVVKSGKSGDLDLTLSPSEDFDEAGYISETTPSNDLSKGKVRSLLGAVETIPENLLGLRGTVKSVLLSPQTSPFQKTIHQNEGGGKRSLFGFNLRQRSEKKKVKMPRVFCVSDVHTDHDENMNWVKSLSLEEYQEDTIIIGGDISDRRDIFEKTLAAFRARFKHVFFVPGNHDLWLRRDVDCASSSYDKLHELLELCESLGVQTRPAKVDGVWIVPLLSWHHESFDTEPDIEGWKGIPSHKDAMMDFKLCRWPSNWNEENDDAAIARKFDCMNEELCSTSSPWEYTSLPDGCEGVNSWDELLLACKEARANGEPVISFSHFLPKIELLPEKRMLFFPNLAKAVGSNYLGKRVDELSPTCHVFGHTHFAWDANINSTRYLQVALAKPAERRVRMRSLSIGAIEIEPFCLWTGDKFCEEQQAHWSEFYKRNERNPNNTTELAKWVERLYTKL